MPESASIRLENYQYQLPEASIARYPLADRSDSRLLLYREGDISQDRFKNLSTYLPDNSWLVFNNTRVIQARLLFKKQTGAAIEIFCLEPYEPADYERAFRREGDTTWICLVGNAKKWKDGPVFLHTRIGGEEILLEAYLEGRLGDAFAIRFQWKAPGITFSELVEHAGVTPIPPYLDRRAEESDRRNYQTVYSLKNGSVAAPTAGLHFTEEMLEQLEGSKIRMEHLTLHVGAGTFVPVKEADARHHIMHMEHAAVSTDFLERWLNTPEGLVAVGTTSTRSLESLYWLGVRCGNENMHAAGRMEMGQWDYKLLPQDVPLTQSIQSLLEYSQRHRLDLLRFSTRMMIVPGYRFRTINGLLTNFHMPGSTLLLLIAAWIGEDWRKVYDYALENGFRFLSYGDSSLLLPRL